MRRIALLLAFFFSFSVHAASVVATGAGHIQIPSAPAAGTSVVSGAANNYTGTAIVLSASTSAMYITGVHVETSAALAATYISVQLMQGGSGAETSIGQYLVPLTTASTVALGFRPIYPPLKVANATRLTVKTADSVGSKTYLVSVEAILQSNVVEDGIAIGTVTTVTNQLTAAQVATGVWQDATAGDFTAAGSIGKSVMNGVALGTGLTVNDLTTKTGFSLAASQHVIVDSGTVTTLTNLPSIPANWLTATGINAGALNGKGDWLLSSSYTAPTNLTAAQIATGVWQDTTAGDFTTALSVGKSIMNGVSLGTGLTVASVSGSVGSVTGLTASNLDATISSRMATYTQPTGFLAATFPSGTVANTTNITAGTITTTTNLTTNNDKTGYALTSAYDPAKTAASVSGVWSEPLAGYTTADTAGKTLSGAGSAGDPWSTALPGSYGAGTAGFIVGSNLNATVSSRSQAGDAMTLSVAYDSAKSCSPASTALSSAVWTGAKAGFLDIAISSRLPTTSYTAPDNASVTAIKGKTDSLTFTVPTSLDVNAHHINDVRLLGTGVPADPWRPQ